MRRDLTDATVDGRARTVLLYELDGARGRYVFDGAALADGLGVLDVEVGQWAAICAEPSRDDGGLALPSGWRGPLWRVRGHAPLSAPPAIAARAPWPRYVPSTQLSIAPRRPWSLAAGTAILTRAAAGDALGRDRRAMDGWILELPDATPGAALLTGATPRWIIATVVGVERTATGDPPVLASTPVLHATAILDHLLD